MKIINQLTALQNLLIELGYNVENITLQESLAVLEGLKEVLKTSEVLNNLK